MLLPIITDLHFGARQASPIFNEFFFKFYENVFFPYLKDHNIKQMACLGDFVEHRKFINLQILDTIHKRFGNPLKQMEVDCIYIPGNHDCPLKTFNTPNAIEDIFVEYSNVKIYPDPVEIDLDGRKTILLPWVNPTNIGETEKLLRETDARLVMGHLEIAGFEMDKGNFCHTGITPRKWFDKFDMVLSGHFHHRSTDGLVTYLGNPYEITWADWNDPRGFHVLDTDTLDLQFIKNPYRMFHKIVYDDRKETLENLNKLDFSYTKNCYVKIVVVEKEHPDWFDVFLDSLYKAGVADVSIVEKYIDNSPSSNSSGSVTTEGIEKSSDIVTILEETIDATCPTELDPQKLKSLMRKIHSDALALESA